MQCQFCAHEVQKVSVENTGCIQNLEALIHYTFLCTDYTSLETRIHEKTMDRSAVFIGATRGDVRVDVMPASEGLGSFSRAEAREGVP